MKTEGCFLKEKMQQNCKCTVIQTSPFSLQFYRNVFLQGKTGDFPDQNYFFKAKSRNRITWMLAIILTRKKKDYCFFKIKLECFSESFQQVPRDAIAAAHMASVALNCPHHVMKSLICPEIHSIFK